MGKQDIKEKHGLGLKVKKDWEKEWQGMPEFVQQDLTPFKTIYVHFASKEDMEEFAKLVDQNIYMTTKYVWYPKPNINKMNKKYYDES